MIILLFITPIFATFESRIWRLGIVQVLFKKLQALGLSVNLCLAGHSPRGCHGAYSCFCVSAGF
jgi:hypothetical protein